MNARRPLLLPMLLPALLLAGCSPPASTGDSEPPLAGARIGAPFALIDQFGHAVTDRSYAGRWRIMYFGYTFCPDVCPTGLQRIGAGLKAFERADPARAAKVVPIFVTVDPARDTPAAIRPFVAAFHPRMVGLTGGEPAIAALARAYGVFAQRGAAQPDGGYLVDHSAQAYLMGPGGEPIALLPTDGAPQAIADELAKWVK